MLMIRIRCSTVLYYSGAVLVLQESVLALFMVVVVKGANCYSALRSSISEGGV